MTHELAGDAMLAHLRSMLDTRWDAPPRECTQALARVPRVGEIAALASLVAAHHDYLEREGRGPGARADAYRRAVDDVVQQVEAGERPSFAGLVALQQIVLVQDDVVRSGEAYCRDRRYGFWPGLPARLAAKLAADAREALDPVAAALRLYLDIIHVHPFVDGNARAARLGLSWWLAGAGCATPRLDAWVRMPKLPGDPPWSLLRLLATMIAR